MWPVLLLGTIALQVHTLFVWLHSDPITPKSKCPAEGQRLACWWQEVTLPVYVMELGQCDPILDPNSAPPRHLLCGVGPAAHPTVSTPSLPGPWVP